MSSDNEIVPISDLERMAAVMAKSSMFRKNPEQIISLMLIAQAEGLHPATAALEYDIIDGKPALKSQSALARFQRAGGKVTWLVRTEAEATATFSHPQSSDVTVTWNMERAQQQGLAGKDNWKKQPGIMLQWRTVAEGVRVCYPACLNRMYTDVEVQDMKPMRNVTPNPDDALVAPPRPVEAVRAQAAQAIEAAREAVGEQKEADPENPLAQRKALETAIGGLAEALDKANTQPELGAVTTVETARNQCKELREMYKADDIDKHLAALRAYKAELEAKAVTLELF